MKNAHCARRRKMPVSEAKMKIVIKNYFENECDMNTSIREAFEKGFRRGVKLATTVNTEPVKHEECEYIVSKGRAGYQEEYKCSVCGDSFYWTPSEMFPNKFNYCRNCGRKIVKFIDKSEG